MFLRILRDSFLRRRRRKLLALTALALGTGVTMATLSVALDIGDQVGRELRSFGANILVRPQADTLALEIGGVDLRPLSEGSFMNEDELPKLKTIFWRHHILAFAPFLHQQAALGGGEPTVLVGTWFENTLPLEDGERFTTGVRALNPNWQLEGAWPTDAAEPQALVGAALAERNGWQLDDEVALTLAGGRPVTLRVRGRLGTGGDEDRQILVPLAWLQQVSGREKVFRQLQVSALVTPEDEFARRDPGRMTPAQYDRWYCTPYVSSIAHQIQEVLPGSRADVVRRVAQAETAILGRVERVLALVSVAALLGAVLAVLSTMTTTVLERRPEIALMKALGADNLSLSGLFLAEAALLGLGGGALGYLGGLAGARWIAHSVFGATVAAKPVLLPLMLALATAAAVAGTLGPLRNLVRTDPAVVLREK
ncbi:MAG: ABC transporter permease [Acidobacteria bacterium]|nr:ABC transporter permease [Acidobacteriota bacterium]